LLLNRHGFKKAFIIIVRTNAVVTPAAISKDDLKEIPEEEFP